MTDDAIKILARNRDLALDEAETCMARGYSGLASHAQGQALAYAEAIRIVERDVPYRCRHLYENSQECDNEGNYLTPDGRRFCNFHAPTDVDLTISGVTE